jgi:hypothetical protein
LKSREDYVRYYLEAAKTLGIDLEPPAEPFKRTAEAAWSVDSYPVEPGDEPAGKSPSRRT